MRNNQKNNTNREPTDAVADGIDSVTPIRIVAAQNSTAVVTADIASIKAILTKRIMVVRDGVFLINPLITVVADYGQMVSATFAKPVSPLLGT